MLVLKNLSQVLTLAGSAAPRLGHRMSDPGIIRDGAVAVRGDKIAWVGPSGELSAEAQRGCRVIDGAGSGLVAIPGFVDSHTHPVFGGLRADEYEQRALGRSYSEIAEAGGGIRASVRQLRATSLEQLVDIAEGYFNLFLAYGTTCIEAKSGYGLSLDEEVKMLKAIEILKGRSSLETVATFLGAHDVPDEFRSSREEYVLRIIEEMIPFVAGRGLARFCDVFCDRAHFSVEESRRILLAARSAGLGLRIHAEELGPTGGAALAAELGARSADHLEWIDQDGIDALRRSGTVATLLPGTAFNLGLQRYPPARSLIDRGVAVALATDFNPGSCFTLNMQVILSIACSQMKMTPAEAITAATINGAYSLGLQDRVGSIERGKQADIVLMQGRDYREIPYFFGVNHCVLTIKSGRVVFDRLEGM